MSYDISLCDKNGPCQLDHHNIQGGTYQAGGSNDAWLNVTYNYSPHFHRTMGEKGIRSIYGKTGGESIPILESAIAELRDDVTLDYWESTEGNAKIALRGLLVFAKARPDGIWEGD